jgi:hypothetical protein
MLCYGSPIPAVERGDRWRKMAAGSGLLEAEMLRFGVVHQCFSISGIIDPADPLIGQWASHDHFGSQRVLFG